MKRRQKGSPKGHQNARSPISSPTTSAVDHAANSGKLRRTVLAASVIGLAVMVIWLRPQNADPPTNSPAPPRFRQVADADIFATYSGSESCRECHAEEYARWTNSHHARAERTVHADLDRAAFDPSRTVRHGSQPTDVRFQNGQPQIVVTATNSMPEVFVPVRVLGVKPLVQYLIPSSGGRWQTTELAHDPAKQEWFNVFGNEDRQPGEWGHWTGRGMTWNSMCASCHNTRLRKNYSRSSGAYETRMAERAVGCEACHGPMKPHAQWQMRHRGEPGDPALRPISRDAMLESCGACHARRAELTGDFTPAERFLDHFLLTIPDQSDLYYPDGQVRDENYEFTSFLSSRMRLAGVRCGDCHDPHSGKTILAGNDLCMRCHSPQTQAALALTSGSRPVSPPPFKAPPISPDAHTFHAAGTPGSFCVDCHMPQTTYMQRHARRDHGFTIPDPLLTRDHGIPNACNRCHSERSAQWALEVAERWYGARLDRPARSRAKTIASARVGDGKAAPDLIRILSEDPVGSWRASAARLLQQFNDQSGAITALVKAAKDPEALVRAGVAHALDGAVAAENTARAALKALLDDPRRAVRVEAAWTARAWLDTNTTAAHDLFLSFEQSADQPAGLHQIGLWHYDRGELDAALHHFSQAVELDPGSAPLRQSLALVLSVRGHPAEAARQLDVACRIEPRQAIYWYQLGLAQSEGGTLSAATSALQEAVRLDPSMVLAWYNLGLAYAAAEDLDRAVETLLRAEQLQPRDPRAPYARATVLARLDRIAEARLAAERALALNPGSHEAAELVRTLHFRAAGASSPKNSPR